MKWHCSNGEIIDIKDMDDRHLNNCIKLTQRRIDYGQQFLNQVCMSDSNITLDAVECENRSNQQKMDALMETLKSLQKEKDTRTAEITGNLQELKTILTLI